jgi:competence protein ComEA
MTRMVLRSNDENGAGFRCPFYDLYRENLEHQQTFRHWVAVNEEGARGFLLIAASLSLLVILAVVNAEAQKLTPSRPVDLNSATITELEQLPGIGPNTAKSIISFREHSGPFQRVEDLLAIKGISKSKLKKLRPYVTVAPATEHK